MSHKLKILIDILTSCVCKVVLDHRLTIIKLFNYIHCTNVEQNRPLPPPTFVFLKSYVICAFR